MKNFKCLKVHVLKHEMHNNIVLMISAVGWTLQEKNERKSLTSPHQMMLSTLLTASILSPIGICYSHLQFSLLGDRPSSLFWPGRYTVLCVSSFLENQNLGFPWLSWVSLHGIFLCIKASSKDGAQQWPFSLLDFNGTSFISWRPESFLWDIFRPFGINVCLSPHCQLCSLSWAGGCLSWDARKGFVGVSCKLWGL